MIRTRENLATNFTLIWLKACVSPHMAGQHITSCERLATNAAHITFRSGLLFGSITMSTSGVFGQSITQREYLLTYWTYIARWTGSDGRCGGGLGEFG